MKMELYFLMVLNQKIHQASYLNETLEHHVV